MGDYNYNKKPVYIERPLIKSKAFQTLRLPASHLVLMVFMTKRQIGIHKTSKREQFYIANNGEIEFTQKEALYKYGVSQGKFTRAIDELLSKGFIEIAATGAGVHKIKTLYTISERWRDYGKADFEPSPPRKKKPINGGFRKGNKFGRNCKKT